MSRATGKTANQLRQMGYGVAEAIADGYSINNDDDRFLIAYKGSWPDTDEFVLLIRDEPMSDEVYAEKCRALRPQGTLWHGGQKRPLVDIALDREGVRS